MLVLNKYSTWKTKQKASVGVTLPTPALMCKISASSTIGSVFKLKSIQTKKIGITALISHCCNIPYLMRAFE